MLDVDAPLEPQLVPAGHETARQALASVVRNAQDGLLEQLDNISDAGKGRERT